VDGNARGELNGETQCSCTDRWKSDSSERVLLCQSQAIAVTPRQYLVFKTSSVVAKSELIAALEGIK
jgi:hypothetical protein